MDPTKSLGETLADMGPVTAGIALALTAAGVAVVGSLVPGLIRAGIAALSSLPGLMSVAIAAVTSASAATLGIGAIAIAAGIAGVIASIASAKSKAVNDGIFPAAGGSGYGKRVLTGPEGSIQLNNKDTVIAGTNLFGNDVKSEPGKSTQMGGKGEIKVKSEGGDMSALIAAINSLQNNIKSLIQIHVDFLKELKLILTPTTKIPTKETTLTKETPLKKEITPSDLLNILTPFSSMLKVGSLLLSKSIETKNNSIKPIENNSIESKQTNIDQNVVKPVGDNTTTPKQNNIDQNVNKSTTFSLFNFQNDTSKSDTGVIQAINGLRSDLKALASRPIHTSVQLDGKELATMQGKYPNEAGDANGKVAYQMS
jgi:hypothetical protein